MDLPEGTVDIRPADSDWHKWVECPDCGERNETRLMNNFKHRRHPETPLLDLYIFKLWLQCFTCGATSGERLHRALWNAGTREYIHDQAVCAKYEELLDRSDEATQPLAGFFIALIEKKDD